MFNHRKLNMFYQ